MTFGDKIRSMSDKELAEVLINTIIQDNDTPPTVSTIPEHPTNGDVQTAILKPYEIMKGKGYVLIYLTKEQREQHHWECWFDLEWWNSPYKRGDKGES